MANRSPKTLKLIGVALAILGLGLEYWAYELSNSLTAQLSSMVTASDTDEVVRYYIGGAVSFIIGIYLIARK